MNDAIRMQLSAFVDGELPENEAELLLRRMSQDENLRLEVAEFLAIGRLIRDEPGLAGADRLHERIAAAIDDHEKPVIVNNTASSTGTSRTLRPLTGVAIAATVALVAIFGLQQNTAVDDLPAPTVVPVANDVVPSIDAQQERQRQYLRNHAETSSALGANGMKSRVVTLRFSEEFPEDPEDAELEQPEEANETQGTVAQP